jgi:hypothetical protein
VPKSTSATRLLDAVDAVDAWIAVRWPTTCAPQDLQNSARVWNVWNVWKRARYGVASSTRVLQVWLGQEELKVGELGVGETQRVFSPCHVLLSPALVKERLAVRVCVRGIVERASGRERVC